MSNGLENLTIDFIKENRKSTEEREQKFDISSDDFKKQIVQDYGLQSDFNIYQVGSKVPDSKHAKGMPLGLVDQADLYVARNQPWSHQAANAIIGGLAGGAITALQGMAYLGDIGNNIKRLQGLEEAENNAIAEALGTLKESLYESLPIYRKDPGSLIDFNDRGFYWEMLRGITESAVGFGVPGLAVGKAVSSATKLMEVFGASKKFQNAINLVGTARATNFIEGKTMALESYETMMREYEDNIYQETVKDLKERNPDMTDMQIDLFARSAVKARMNSEEGKAQSQIAAKEADDFIRSNRVFMLTDMIALGGMFKGKQLYDNIIEKRTFKNLAKDLAKQSPVEYLEEVGQNVLQMQEEYDGLKAMGMDVSQDPDTWLERSIKYATSEQAQLEGMMGLFGGPMQFMAVQSPTYFGGMKDHNKAYAEQQEQIAKNTEYVKNNIAEFTQTQYNKNKAYASGNDMLADFIDDVTFDGLAYENMERGTYKALKEELEEVAGGKKKIEEADNAQEQAGNALKRLEELRKDYVKIKNRESSPDQGAVRRQMFIHTQRRKSLISAIEDLNSKISTNSTYNNYNESSILNQKKRAYQKSLGQVNDLLAKNKKSRKNYDTFVSEVEKARQDLGLSRGSALVIANTKYDAAITQEDLSSTISELSRKADALESQANSAKKESKKAELVKKAAVARETIEKLDKCQPSVENDQRPVGIGLAQLTKRKYALDQEEKELMQSANEINSKIEKTRGDLVNKRNEEKDYIIDDERSVVEGVDDETIADVEQLVDIETALDKTNSILQKLGNKKTRSEEIERLKKQQAEIQKDITETSEASKSDIKRSEELDELAQKYEYKVFTIDVAGTKRNVFIDPNNPKQLVDVENVKGKTKRYYRTEGYKDQLNDKNIRKDSLSEGEIKSFLIRKNNPESLSTNKPDGDNVETLPGNEFVDPAKPDFLGVGFGKTAGNHLLENNPDALKQHLKNVFGLDLTDSQINEIIDSQLRFFKVSEILDLSSGKYGLMVVTSSSNPYTEDNLTFIEKERTVDGADIKLVLVNQSDKSPIRINGQLIYTSMSLPEVMAKSGEARFTVRDGKEDLWKGQHKSFAEALAKIKNPSIRDAVISEIDHFNAFRQFVIETGHNVYLKIEGKSNGVENKSNDISSIVGKLISEDVSLADVKIEVSTTGRVYGSNGDIAIAPGSVFVVTDGIINRLMQRKLNDREIYNIILMLQHYSKASLTDPDARFILDKDGKKTDIDLFQTINNIVFFGGKSLKNKEFGFAFQNGTLVYGENSMKESDFSEYSINLNEDGSINTTTSSPEIVGLIEFLRNKYHHVNKKSLESEVEFLNVEKDDDGNIYKSSTTIVNYNQYLLEGANPVLGTKNKGVDSSALKNEDGTINRSPDPNTFDNIKANPNRLGVYLTFDYRGFASVDKKKDPAATAKSTGLKPVSVSEAIKTLNDKKKTDRVRFEFVYDGQDVFIELERRDDGKFDVVRSVGIALKDNVATADHLAAMDDVGASAFIVDLDSISTEPEKSTFVEDGLDAMDRVVDVADEKPAEKSARDEFGDTEPYEPMLLADLISKDSYKKADLEDELSWFKYRFPDVDIEIVRNLIDNKAYGKLTQNGKVLISNAATEGTVYHEAWHVLSLMALSGKERNDLYNEYRRVYGNKDQTDKQVEEGLAEMFREYVLSGGNFNVSAKKARSFFQKIYDFLVSLFTNKDIKTAFEDLYNNNLKSYELVSTSASDSYMELNDVRIQNMVMDSMDQMFFGNFFQAGVDFEDIFNLGGKDFNDKYIAHIETLYSTLLRQIKYMLKESYATSNSDVEKENILSWKNYIEENWSRFTQLHRDHLGTKYNVDINFDELEDDDYVGKTRDGVQYIESMQFSAKDKASSVIKMLIASLPRYEFYDDNGVRKSRPARNSLGLPMQVSSGYMFNRLHNLLAGTQSYEEQIDILRNNIHIHPEFESLIHRLNSGTDYTPDSISLNKVNLQNKFFQQFAKTKNKSFTVILGTNGKIYLIDNSQDRIDKHVRDIWMSNFKLLYEDNNSPITIVNGEVMISKDKEFEINGMKTSISRYSSQKFSLADKLSFVEKLGIEFSNKDVMLESLTDAEERAISQDIDFIIDYINKKEDNITNLFLREKADIQGRINNLIQAELRYNTTVNELQHLNPENKPVYDITLNTFISTIVNQLNRGQIPEHLSKDGSIYQRYSKWLEMAKKGLKIDVVILEGSKQEGIVSGGRKISKLSKADRAIISVNAVLNGISPFLRASDRSVEYGFKVPGFGKNMSKSMFAQRMYEYLAAEVETVIYERDNASNKDTKNYSKNKNKLRFFNKIIKNVDLSSVENFSKFEEQYGKDKLMSQIEAYADSVNKSTRKFLGKNKVFKAASTGRYKTTGIATEIVARFAKPDQNNTISDSELANILSTYTYNYIIGNIEQTKVFTGDPAYYKDFFKRTTGLAATKKLSRVGDSVDRFMNNNMQRIDGKAYDGRINTYVVTDVNVKSSELHAEYKKAIGGLADNYLNMDETDGQGYMSLDAYREILFRSEKWTPDQERLYQWIKDKREGKEVGLKPFAIFPPLKPQYFGPQANADKYIPVFYKFSVIPIYEEMFQDGQKLRDLAVKMTENKMDMFVFETVVKVGIPENNNSLYDENGNINDIDTNKIQQIDLKYFGLQLDIEPKRKKKAIFGTQTRSLFGSNMFENGIPADFAGDNWAELSEEERLNQSAMYKIKAEFDDIVNDLVDDDLEYLMNEMGLVFNKDKQYYEFSENNYSKIGDIVVREMRSRNMGQSDIDAVKYIFSSKEVYVDFMNNSDKVESLLYSLINNNVVKQKMTGDMMVQVSVAGFESENRNVNEASNALSFYKQREDGTTSPMEVYIPHYFKEFFKTPAEFRIVDGRIVDSRGKEISVDPRLLDIIGFRIPTSGLNSMEFMTIKQLLASTMGSTIVAPSEVVVKTGADFDVDKMTVYFPNYFFNKDGIAIYIDNDSQYDEYVESFTNRLRNIFLRNIPTETKKLNSEVIRMMLGDVVTKVKNGADPREATEEIRERVRAELASLDPSVQRNKMILFKLSRVLDILENSSYLIDLEDEKMISKREFERSVKQNRILEIMKERLSSQYTFNEFIAPIVTSTLESATDKVREKKGLSKTEGTPQEWMEPEFVSDIAEKYWTGEGGIGIVANNITSHAKSQQAGLFVKSEKYRVNLEGANKTIIGGVDYVSMAGINDSKGRSISSILNELANAVIDIASNPFPADANINMNTLGVASMLIRMGIPAETIIYFLSQPAVVDYVNNESIMKSQFLRAAGIPRPTRARIIQETLGIGMKELMNSAPTMFNDSMLESELTNPSPANQAALLRDFLAYKDLAMSLNTIILSSAHDTKFPKSKAEYMMMEDKKNTDLVDAYEIFGVRNFKIEDTGFMPAFKNAFEASKQMYSSMFFAESNDHVQEFVKYAVDSLVLNKDYVSSDDMVKEIRRVTNAALTYFLQNSSDGEKKLADVAMKMIVGSESVPFEFHRYAKDSTNPVFKELVASLDGTVEESGKAKKTSYVKMLSRRIETVEKEELIAAMYQLKEDNQDLYNKLIDLSFIQAGVASSFYSFKDIIPPIDYYNRMVEILSNVSDEGNFNEFISMFIHNNMNNPFYVEVLNTLSDDVFIAPEIVTIEAKSRSQYIKVLDGDRTYYGIYSGEGFAGTNEYMIIRPDNNRYLQKYFVSLASTEENDSMTDDVFADEGIAFDQLADVSEQTVVTESEQTTIKEGVSELFESNPELANSVYEALGFKQENSNIEILTSNYTRQSVQNDVDTLYLFTDNAQRTSRPTATEENVDKNSWYYKKYKFQTDKPIHFGSTSNPTSAVIRGLNNAYPISTMSAYGTNWTNTNFELFKQTINDEITQIKQDLPKFSKIKIGDFRIGQGGRFAKLPQQHQDYLDAKLLEIGIDNTGNKPKISSTEITPQQKQQAQQLYQSFLDVYLQGFLNTDGYYALEEMLVVNKIIDRKCN